MTRIVTAGALALAVALGGPATMSLGQDDPTSSSPTPTETSTPPVETTTPSTPAEPTPPSEPPSSTPAEPTTPSSPAEPTTPTTPSEEPTKPAEEPAQEKPVEQPQEKAAEAGPTADLKTTVAFDKPEYQAGENFEITVTVRNTGEAPAKDVRFATESWSVWLRSGYEQLTSRPTIGPGEQKVIKLGAALRDPRDRHAQYTVRSFLEGIADPTPGNNSSTATAKVIQKRGTASGVLYSDANGNGKPDAGEGIGNHMVTAEGGVPQSRPFAMTAPDGSFNFTDATPGAYKINLYDNQLYPSPGAFVIEEGKNTVLNIATVAPIQDALAVKVELDNARYGQAAPVSIKVTLTNKKQAPLAGVVAICQSDYTADWYLDGTGPGWAVLSPDGPGVALAAGETKEITITDVVHEAAYLAGRIGVACNFGNNGRTLNGGVGGSDFAIVEGAFGTVTGKLVHGDTGEALKDVRIVGLDPKTGRPFISVTTDANGEWRTWEVRKGAAKFRAVGPWKHADGSDGVPVEIIGGQQVVANFAVVPGPEVADPSKYNPDIEVTASFDKASYDVYDQIQLKIKISHVGSGMYATQGRLNVSYLPNSLYYDESVLRHLTYSYFELWPGESREVTVVGEVRPYSSQDTVAFKANFESSFTDPTPANNAVDLSAKVTYGIGHAAFTAYGDKNENGQLDVGEELADRKVSIQGGRPQKQLEGNTDASGKIAFRDLSAGAYVLYSNWDDSEWVLPREAGQFVVDAGAETIALLRFVRPLSDKVKASIVFDQPSYEPGARVGLTVTLTNGTDEELRFRAHCNGYGSDYALNNDEDWGDYYWDGPGVLIGAGKTKSVHIETDMPKASPDHGLVTAPCIFGPDLSGIDGLPSAIGKAKVPGATWTTKGRVLINPTYPEEKGVANTKVVLLDVDTNQPVARTVTDANGAFTFPDVPVGHYTPVVVGPWKVLYHKSGPLFAVVRGWDYPNNILVEPGLEVEDPDTGAEAPPVIGGPGLPPLTAVKGGALATTGASVLGLAAFGLLLVMAGFALRRRPSIA